MARKQKLSSTAFGKLVQEKLAERGWSQRTLGFHIDRAPSYVSYVIQNPNARGGKFGLNPEVVKRIADILAIPIEEAFETAGLDLALAKTPPIGSERPPGESKKPLVLKTLAAPDDDLLAIASRAALGALKHHTAKRGTGKPAGKSVSSAGTITIDLPDGARITLETGRRDMTPDEITRYTLALRVAYESVRQTT